MEMYQSGELQQALGVEAAPAEEPVVDAAVAPAAPLSIENRL